MRTCTIAAVLAVASLTVAWGDEQKPPAREPLVELTLTAPPDADTTRDERIEIARQAEHRYQRKVAWGARLGDRTELFTVASVPVMTRLRQPERVVLDTLVDSGVARSRSDALAWAVRLVGQHADEWLGELRAAMARVDDLRAKGPTGTGSDEA